MKVSPLLALAFLLPSVSTRVAQGADWPQWRGPARDGVVSDPAHKLTKLPQDPKPLWEIAVGPGQASPIVVQNRLLLMDGLAGKEVLHCLAADTGKELWQVEIGPMVEFQNAYGEGPRCTPLVDEDRVYAQSCGGEFRCLSLIC